MYFYLLMNKDFIIIIIIIISRDMIQAGLFLMWFCLVIKQEETGRIFSNKI